MDTWLNRCVCVVFVVLFYFTVDVLAWKDASDVTWSRPLNKKEELQTAFKDDVTFLKADVTLGHIKGEEFGATQPIMARPPDCVSDVTLADWLDTIIEMGVKKGIKLDIKSTEAIKPTYNVLRERKYRLPSPLWIHADVLPAPGDRIPEPVNATTFLNVFSTTFTSATISLGWTTTPYSDSRYDWENVHEMAQLVRCRGISMVSFSARAEYIPKSTHQLIWLVEAIPGSSLTIWSEPNDRYNVSALLHLRSLLPKSIVYYDLANDRKSQEFKWKKENYIHQDPKPALFKSENWILVDPSGESDICLKKPIITPTSVMFVSRQPTLILLKHAYITDNRLLYISAKVRFFYPRSPHREGTGFKPKPNLSVVLGSVPRNSSAIPSSADLEWVWDSTVYKQIFIFGLRFNYTESDTHKSKCAHMKYREDGTVGNRKSNTTIMDCKGEDQSGHSVLLRVWSFHQQEMTSPVAVGIRFQDPDMIGLIYDLEIHGKIDPYFVVGKSSGLNPTSLLSFIGILIQSAYYLLM